MFIIPIIARLIKGLMIGFKDQEFRALFIFVLIILAAGTIGFHSLEHWGWLDSLYHSVTTLTTVGDNRVPVTAGGKIFSIVYIIVGIGSVAAMITELAAHTRSSHPRRRRSKED